MSKYHGRTDPIELLRNVFTNKKSKIKLKGKDLYFDKEAKLALATQTAWMSPQTNKRYNLGSLWLFIEHELANTQSSGEYIQKVSEYELEPVNVADRNEIMDYFTGKISQTSCINQQLKLSLSQNRKRDHPSLGFDNSQDNVAKKIKADDSIPFQLQVIDYLTTFERPTSSKSRCMVYPNKAFDGILKNISQQQKKTQQSSDRTGTKYRIVSILENKRLPIIIVPDTEQLGNIKLSNAEKFLIHEQYSQNSELQNPWASKIEIMKDLRGKRIAFEVTNRPTLLLEKDWDNVVAIFVQGRQNQFEGWPYQSPKKVFQKPRGFFLRYTKTSIQYAQQWKVKNLVIDRNTRYGDKQIVKIIWNEIQAYIFQRI